MSEIGIPSSISINGGRHTLQRHAERFSQAGAHVQGLAIKWSGDEVINWVHISLMLGIALPLSGCGLKGSAPTEFTLAEQHDDFTGISTVQATRDYEDNGQIMSLSFRCDRKADPASAKFEMAVSMRRPEENSVSPHLQAVYLKFGQQEPLDVGPFPDDPFSASAISDYVILTTELMSHGNLARYKAISIRAVTWEGPMRLDRDQPGTNTDGVVDLNNPAVRRVLAECKHALKVASTKPIPAPPDAENGSDMPDIVDSNAIDRMLDDMKRQQ